MSLWSVPGLVELAFLFAAGASPLPPVKARPRSAATAAASHQLVERADAADNADKPDEAIDLLRQAVAAEPANHQARVALAAALLDQQHPDEALAILTQLHDARCRACLRAVTDFVVRMHDSMGDPTLRGKLDALVTNVHGRPTPVSRAADAVWKAFERQDWRLLAPYIGDRTRIKTIETLTDDPNEAESSVALSPARMRAWFETQVSLDLHRDENWFCNDRCCKYWSWYQGRGDVTNYLERICFDTSSGRPILTRLEWESG